METLIAVAFAVGMLKATAAPPAEPPKVAVEQPKARVRDKAPSRSAPILGY
jgi:hypothetical protein